MRKSISVAFFSLVSTLMVLGIVLMGASEWVLFKNYFAKDRYETLDQVVGVTQRTAQYLVQQAELPEGDEPLPRRLFPWADSRTAPAYPAWCGRTAAAGCPRP